MNILYSREKCCLCQNAKTVLNELGIEYTEIDVSGNVELEALYGWDIPVLSQNGTIVHQGVFNKADLMEKGGAK